MRNSISYFIKKELHESALAGCRNLTCGIRNSSLGNSCLKSQFCSSCIFRITSNRRNIVTVTAWSLPNPAREKRSEIQSRECDRRCRGLFARLSAAGAIEERERERECSRSNGEFKIVSS